MRTHCLTARGARWENELRAGREYTARLADASLKEGAVVRESGLQNTPRGYESDFHSVGRYSIPPTQLACSAGLILHWRKGSLTAVDMRARQGQRGKCLTVAVFRSGLMLRCTGLDSALSQIGRMISSSRRRGSGPIELQRGRGRLLRRTRNANGT